MTGANITAAEDKDALIRSLQEQLKAKDKQIASLEDTVIGMSLELATSKAMEDYQHQQLQQQRDKHKDKTWMSRLQEEEEESQASQPQQQRRPSRRSPRCISQSDSAINVMSSINKSLSDMLSSMKPHRNNDKTNTIDAIDDTPTVSSSSLQSFGSSQQPSSDDSREQLQQSVESSGVIVLASRESRKLSMGLSDVVDWDSSKNSFTGWD